MIRGIQYFQIQYAAKMATVNRTTFNFVTPLRQGFELRLLILTIIYLIVLRNSTLVIPYKIEIFLRSASVKRRQNGFRSNVRNPLSYTQALLTNIYDFNYKE